MRIRTSRIAVGTPSPWARVRRAVLASAIVVAMAPLPALAEDGATIGSAEAEATLALADDEMFAQASDDVTDVYGGAVSAAFTDATTVTFAGHTGYSLGRGRTAPAMENPVATISFGSEVYAQNVALVDNAVSIEGHAVRAGVYTATLVSDNYVDFSFEFTYPATNSVSVGGCTYEWIDADTALALVDADTKATVLASFTQIGETSIYYRVADGSEALPQTAYGMSTTKATSYTDLYNAMLGNGAAAAADYDAISSATGIAGNAHYGQLSPLVARNIVYDKAALATATDEQKLENAIIGAYATPTTVNGPAYAEAYILSQAGRALTDAQTALLAVKLNGNAAIDPATVTDRVAVDTVTTSGFYTSATYFDPTELSGSKAYGHLKLIIRPTAGDNTTGGVAFSWADYYSSLYAGTLSDGTTTVGMAPWIDLYTEAGHSAVEMSISNGTNPYNESNRATVNRFASMYDEATGRLKAGDYTVTLYAAGYNPLSYTFHIGAAVPTNKLQAVAFQNADVEGKTATVVAYELNDGEGNVAKTGDTYVEDGVITDGVVQLDKRLVAGDYKANVDGYVYTFSVSSVAADGWKRLAGSNRYDTMAAIVEEGFDTASTAILCTGQNFPDALVAASLAGALDGDVPVILTKTAELTKQAADQLDRLGVSKVYILGGKTVVTDDVAAAVEAKGIAAERVAGSSRQLTSLEVMKLIAKAGKFDGTVVVATGKKTYAASDTKKKNERGFADALSIAPWCYKTGTPILLTDKNGKLTDAQAKACKELGVSDVIIVGGETVVSDEVYGQLGLSKDSVAPRLGGKDRYETSGLIADFERSQGMTMANAAVATGANFPDALAGSALCGKNNSVLLLANDAKEANLVAVNSYVSTDAGIEMGYVLGGDSAVSPGLFSYLVSLVW